MPGYGIAGPEEGGGLLPWSWAEEQLVASRNFWLATHWPDGRPHAMPVGRSGTPARSGSAASKGSRKASNLAADPRCVLTTEDPTNPVVLEGKAELLTDTPTWKRCCAAENAKYGTDYGIDMLDPAVNCAYRCVPLGLRPPRGEFTGSPTRWTFE